MTKILGLDLGTSSIGWALIDDTQKKIIQMGSRVFPEGVENLGEGEGREMSKNASRTGSRGARRQFFRRRLRKKILLRTLAEHQLCPISVEKFKLLKQSPQLFEIELADWFKLNPYELRQKALTEKISLHELGRIFYHIIQRRGFLSNSRSASKDDGAIFKGDIKAGKIGISETLEKIQDHTLGSYLYEIMPKDNQSYTDGLERIRNRYTTRSMYINEFEQIWEAQSKFHPSLNSALKELIGGRKKDGYNTDGVLFHQRPLRSQKHLVGYCSFEPKKTKCPISAIPFEEFRVYQWVNTVEYNGKRLNEEERKVAAELLLRKEKTDFKAIRKALGKIDNQYKFNYKDDDKIVGTYTISNLCSKKYFGEEWFSLTDKEKEDIWHALYFFEDKDFTKNYAQTKWGFDEDSAVAISKFNLKDGYANLSRKAINNILPFLKEGYHYDIAVVFGGVKNALGQQWKQLTCEQLMFLNDNIPAIVRSKTKGGFIEPLKEVLKEEFNLTDKELEKLYHHSAAISVDELVAKLPVNPEADKEIQSIKNPVVITALFELRKLVNELIETYGKVDEIKVELARDLKSSKSKRNDVRRDQKRLEKENDRVKDRLEELGQRVTHDNILLYKLWEECKHTCPYTGKEISVTDLFTNKFQIEHIIPWSRSLDDSFMNKTLCEAKENIEKGNQTPFEYYSKQSEAKWTEVKERALKLFSDTKEYPNSYQKFKRFVQAKVDDDFISRQLNDTRYISKEAKNYLQKICKDVQIAPGQMTSNLRHKWGLNTILNPLDDEKTRDDHRHHAIDALVMACSKRSYLQELSKWNRYNRSYKEKDFPLPWDGFWSDAQKQIEQVLVSHKKLNKVVTLRTHKTKKNGIEYKNLGVAARGQLHKETIYGKRKAPNSEEAFHVRKPIDSLTTKKQLDKVVDAKIRQLIYQRIAQLGGFTKGDTIPNETFFTTDANGIKQPMLFLPNKNGAPVPIKKVRMSENIGNAEQLKDKLNQFVNQRNNHHILIYIDDKGQMQEEVVAFWTAVERKKQGQAVFQLPADGVEIVTTLQMNEMFLLGLNEDEINWENKALLKNHLYRVQKLSSKFYEFRLVSESSLKNTFNPYYSRITSFGDGKAGWQTFNPIKVTVSVAGDIKPV